MPYAQAEEEFLLPSQAFVLSAEAVDHDTVKVNWQIAEGYYLYKSKLRFTTEQNDIVLGEAKLPKAILKEDPIFGEVMTYWGKLSIDLPINQRPDEAIDLELQTRSQGCADKGICYPPQTQKITVTLPAKPSVAEAITPANEPLAALGALSEELG